MKATKIRLKNFRSFGEDVTEINIQQDLTAIIGANSCGKTALLEAIRKMFGSTNAERTISMSDFHIPANILPERVNECELFIEIVFDYPESIEDELDESSGISDFFGHMVVSEPGEAPYLRIRLQSIWKRDSIDSEGIIETRMIFLTCPKEEEENDQNTPIFPSYQRPLIQASYVPAIRKPSEQLKFVSGSVLFRLLKRIKEDEEFGEDFKSKLGDINALFKNNEHFGNVQNELSSLWNAYHKDTRYSNAGITFGSTDFDSILKKLEIEFTPTESGRPYKIDDLGEGYRSLFYLTLVSTLLKIENELELEENEKPLLTILLIEEPENHIAPQLLGRVLKNLKNLSTLPNVQVILTSHTPSIVRRIDPLAIRHFRLDEKNYKTIVSNITLPKKRDEAYKYIKEAVRNYPEIYFSKLVILGEGDSEEIIFNKLAEVYEQDFDDHFITVAPLGGRYVNHIWKLLTQLGIPYITLLDLDRERNGGGWGRVKYALQQLIANKPKKKSALLQTTTGVLSDDRLDTMHEWDVTSVKTMDGWISSLERYDVFFSAPLDLDFIMLSSFEKEYKDIGPKGPKIPNKAEKPEDYSKKLETSISATLKSEGATGVTYSEKEKELMIWYNYLFLGREKPATHITAISEISEEDLKSNMPHVLKKVFKRIKEIIE